MATNYNIKVKAVSAFVNYSEEEVQNIMTDIISNYKHKDNGLGFESIEVKVEKADANNYFIAGIVPKDPQNRHYYDKDEFLKHLEKFKEDLGLKKDCGNVEQPKQLSLFDKITLKGKYYVIKDNSENQWFARIYKNHKSPNFTSSIDYARKYNLWIVAKIRAILLGNCEVQLYYEF